MKTNTAYRFTDAEMETARETDLPDLLESLGYHVQRIGAYHTTKEMDSLRIQRLLLPILKFIHRWKEVMKQLNTRPPSAHF